MQVEADWVMKVIREAQKGRLTIKPLAAGQAAWPIAGLLCLEHHPRPGIWSQLAPPRPLRRARLSKCLSTLLARRIPAGQLQETRSKKSLK